MDVLTDSQSRFLKNFSRSPLQSKFYLTGGTALSAFYLMHRFSDDLDFFTSDRGAFVDLQTSLESLVKPMGWKLVIERSLPTFFDADMVLPNDQSIKIDFAFDSPFRLSPIRLNPDFGIYMDNETDLSCNKLSALFDRSESKDFVDVYFILKEIMHFDLLLENARKKHVGMEPHFLAKAFLRVQDITFLPRMIKPLELKSLQAYFLDLAQGLMDQLKS